MRERKLDNRINYYQNKLLKNESTLHAEAMITAQKIDALKQEMNHEEKFSEHYNYYVAELL